jgi:hypothetical protein
MRSFKEDWKMSEKVEAYLVRRIQQLRVEGFTDHQIIERLVAVVPSKRQLTELIQKVSQ